MKIKWRETRPGHYQIYFSHQGKQIFLQKDPCGESLRDKNEVIKWICWLEAKGYNPQDWNKDKSFLFENAVRNWIKLSTCSQEWKDQRRQIANRFFIPFLGKKDIRQIKTIHINEFRASLEERELSAKTIYNVIGELKTFSMKALPSSLS